MKMTKIVPFAMTALLIGGAAVAPATSANTGEAIEANGTDHNEAQKPQVQPIFIKIAGIVEDVEVRDDATLYTMKQGDDINRFFVTDNTLVFDQTGKEVKLQKGDKVMAYTYANKPMIMIYPPQYNPEVIIVETEEMGSTTVDFFDKDLVNADNTLKLNVGEETALQSLSGKDVTVDDLADQHLLVFYTITTMSIPAQTPPSKVIVLDEVVEDSGEADPSEVDPGEVSPSESAVQEIIKKDYYEVDGTTMVPLRLIAEELGFKVDSTGKGAIVSKGALSYTITRGEKAYGYNKALRYFEVAPALLEPTKTYVPVEFVEELLK